MQTVTGVAFVDGSGAQVAFYHDGTATDSAASAAGTGATVPVTVTVLSQTGTQVSVGVSTPPSWLADPARVFPVTVDPTLNYNTSSSGFDAYVSKDYPTTPEGTYDPTALKVGTYNGGGEADRAFVFFGPTGVDGTGDQIVSANLAMYETTSWSCNLGATPALNVFGVAGGWNPGGLTWNNQPAGQTLGTSVVAANGYSGCPAAWVNMNVTNLVQAYSNNSQPDNGFTLSTNEANSYGWKIFSSGDDGAGVAPALSITYGNCTSYNSPATGTHQVCGAIRDKYNALGGPAGFLGYPTTDETTASDGVGRYNHFQNATGYHSPVDGNTGSIYWTPNFGAWSIQGAIRDEWLTIGATQSVIGYPVTDQNGLPTMPGAYNHFNNLNGAVFNDGHTGSIYWSAATGAHEIAGAIRNEWEALHWETSYLGLPTSDEFAIPGGRRNNFSAGQINWIATNSGYGQLEATAGATAGAGTPGYYTYDSHTLSDNLTAKVNVGTGNLNVTMGLLGLPGVAGTTPFAIDYNSVYGSPQAQFHGSPLTGPGWRMSPQTDVSLVTYGDGSASYFGPDGNSATFTANGTTTLTQPPGLSSTLTHTSGQNWFLTDHSSGQVLTFGPNGGSVISQADRNGNTITYTYTNGYVASMIAGTRAGGNPITFTYGGTCPNNQLCSASQTADGVTHSFAFTYNSGSNTTMATVTEHASGSSPVAIPADRVTRFGYDSSNDLTSIVDPSGVTTTVGYSSDGQDKVTSFDQDSTGIKATTTYDYTSSFGNTLVHDPDTVAPYNHGMTTYGIDGFGRVITTTDAMGHMRPNTWTAQSNVETATDAMSPGNKTTFGYDPAGNNLTSATTPMGAAGYLGYTNGQAFGTTGKTCTTADTGHPYQAKCGMDPQGSMTSYSYDDPGNQSGTSTMTPTGTVTTSATYMPTNPSCGGKPGQQCTSTDGNGHVTTYAYDPPTGNLLSVTPPAGGALKASTYTTNGSGQLVTVTDGKAQTTTTVYDAFGRSAQVVVGSATTSLGYDLNGRTVSRDDPSGPTRHYFDNLGRETSETLSNQQVALGATYDPAGNVLTYSDATGTVTYAYNADNQVTSIADPGGSCTANPTVTCTTFAYNNNGARTTTTYPGGVTMTVNPDNSGRTTDISATSSAGPLYHYTYNYFDPTTNPPTDRAVIQTRTDAVAPTHPVTNYTYDTLSRLTNAVVNTGPNTPTTASWLYCYDPAGNRTADTTNIGVPCPAAPAAGANTYTYDPTDALATKNGSAAGIAYDNNGNQTAGPGIQPLTAGTHNGYNQLTAITANTTPTTSSYAGTTNAERLTSNTAGVTTNYSNGFFGLNTTTTTAGTTGYTRDPSGTLIDERPPTGGTYYYLYDGTGSVIGLTDHNGVEVNTYQYDPYGNSLAKTEGVLNPFQYEAGYQDTTGLIKFGARYYNPQLGQWTQLDPSGQNPGYQYAGDDPINSADISGLANVDNLRALANAIAGFISLFTPFNPNIKASAPDKLPDAPGRPQQKIGKSPGSKGPRFKIKDSGGDNIFKDIFRDFPR
ncbi:MAG: DNRLRE domain-containing protein [Acidimicrobiales bacterium]